MKRWIPNSPALITALFAFATFWFCVGVRIWHGPFKYWQEYDDLLVTYTASQLWFPSIVVFLLALAIWKLKSGN